MRARAATTAPRPGDPLPPLLYPAAAPDERRWLARLVAARRVRRVGPRLYASIPADQLTPAIRGSWMDIVAALYPGALVSHRTALELRPSESGEIWLTSTAQRTIAYPGLRLRFVRGPAALTDDPVVARLRSSSRPRAWLENLAADPASAGDRALPPGELAHRLEQILEVEGEHAVDALRERAHQIARRLGWQRAYQRLAALIQDVERARTLRMGAHAGLPRPAREPFDAACHARLQALFAELHTRPLPALVERAAAPDHVRNKAFFEAYFSSQLDGARFAIEEAERIVFDRACAPRRPRDAHDLAATFRMISDPAQMRSTPRDLAELLGLVHARHQALMAGRPAAEPDPPPAPGGPAVVPAVDPANLVGTLRKAMALYLDLRPGLARAIFMMFVIADAHPLGDGNARIARIMMNAELVSAHQPTLIVPTVYRDHYRRALGALTRHHRPGPLVTALVAAQGFSHLDFASYPAILAELERRNWFRDPRGSLIAG